MIIDIENAKKELIHYVEEQKEKNLKVPRKLAHIMRVTKNSKELATKLNLEEEQIQLAELIGLLHDIGRFEQYKKVNAKTDSINLDTTTKFNHGEAGIEILKRDHYIRNYIKQDKYDDIILTAIYEHNRYELSQSLTKEQELFSKIIKDADKIDLIYEAVDIYWQKPEDIKEIENGKLSEKMLENFYHKKLADNRNSISKTDEILRFASFIYDINFPCSLRILKENNNISKMINRFQYQLPKTKEEMQKVKEIVEKELSRD